jgi:hypothetical protein
VKKRINVEIPENLAPQVQQFVRDVELKRIRAKQVEARMEAAVAIWNRQAQKIDEQIELEEHTDKDASVRWRSWVWEEIKAWVLANQVVSQEEFDFICRNRRFNSQQRFFLSTVLLELGLGNVAERRMNALLSAK